MTMYSDDGEVPAPETSSLYYSQDNDLWPNSNMDWYFSES